MSTSLERVLSDARLKKARRQAVVDAVMQLLPDERLETLAEIIVMFDTQEPSRRSEPDPSGGALPELWREDDDCDAVEKIPLTIEEALDLAKPDLEPPPKLSPAPNPVARGRGTKAIALVGQRHGAWLVLRYEGEKQQGQEFKQFVRLRCVCGTELVREASKWKSTLGCCPACSEHRAHPIETPPKQQPKAKSEKQRKDRQNRMSHRLHDLIRKRKEVLTGEVDFTITPKDIFVPKLCPISNVRLKPGPQKSPNSPTIVRLDMTKGWVPDNVRVMSWAAAQTVGLFQS